MKSVELKVIPTSVPGEDGKEVIVDISYKNQLIHLMSIPADGRSASIDEMRSSIRVMDALQKVPDPEKGSEFPVVELEDADYTFMKQKVLGSRWPQVDKEILAFIDDVTNLPGLEDN